MAENEWKIGRAGTHCKSCNAAFEPGNAYYSMLLNAEADAKEKNETDGGGFVRADLCVTCFTDKRPENVFYFWKTMLSAADSAEPKKQRTVVDVDNVFEFFKRLEGEKAAQKVAFRYILALILARKKRLQAAERRDGADGRPVQIYREKGSSVDHPVTEPELSAEEIAGLSDELGVLLGMAPARDSGSVAQPSEGATEQKDATRE